MGRTITLFKPGEKAPSAGTFYCCVCSMRDERSTCEMNAGQMFLACPRCLERKVAEWDLAWKSDREKPSRGSRPVATPWPGSLAKRI